MLASLAGLLMAAEVARAEVHLQQTADVHFVQQSQVETDQVTITYDVSTSGTVKTDLEEFRARVESILLDSRGWKRAGVTFVPVEANGQMHVVVAEPDVIEEVPGCSGLLSCRYGSMVYINDDRWLGASDSYIELGVSVFHYQEMVLNHEVGHYLGHGHIETCETESGKAPVMLQQSTGLRGCSPNYWPLPSELWFKL